MQQARPSNEDSSLAYPAAEQLPEKRGKAVPVDPGALPVVVQVEEHTPNGVHGPDTPRAEGDSPKVVCASPAPLSLSTRPVTLVHQCFDTACIPRTVLATCGARYRSCGRWMLHACGSR